MAEIKDKKYGKTAFYIDGNEIKDKNMVQLYFI